MKYLIALVSSALLAAFALVLFGPPLLRYVRPPPQILTAGDLGDLHPGETIDIRFSRPRAANMTITLQTKDGRAVGFHEAAQRGADPLVSITPEPPLAWQTAYRLCITLPHRAVVNWLTGPERDCAAIRTMARPAPRGTADAPILVIEGADRPFARTYADILRAEGLNAFATLPAEMLDQAALAHRRVVVLASADLPKVPRTLLLDWTRAGGLLIAMRPGPELRRAIGLEGTEAGRLGAARLLADARDPLSRGITRIPLGIHGPVDLVDLTPPDSAADQPGLAAAPPPVAPQQGRLASTLITTRSAPAQPGPAPEAGLRILAHLQSPAGEILPYPAVAMVPLGKGHAASFAFSLAQSVVYSRQGNPHWVGQERDGSAPRRASDLFYPDFVDLALAEAPAADELQRLFANMVTGAAPMPLPRMWYLPGGRRAAIIMAGDDHATPDGTQRLFKKLAEISPPQCKVADWTCPRATAYLTPQKVMLPAFADRFTQMGFELGVHVDTGCRNPDTAELRSIVGDQFAGFRATFPDLPRQQTHRIHCIIWNGWTDLPKIERALGVRLDMNYYSWPPKWIAGRPGFMTGSGFPMPYVDRNGQSLDIYQATTHLVNESGVPQRYGIGVMLDRALGPEQFFGAFGTHYDYTDPFANKLVEMAQSRGVAMISAGQMLRWLDARNGTGFGQLDWQGDTLSFTVTPGVGALAAGAMAYLPARQASAVLARISCAGAALPLTREVIKGREVAFFPLRAGRCEAIYSAPEAVPPNGPAIAGDPVPPGAGRQRSGL